MSSDELTWVKSVDGYSLALKGNKLLCQNPKGQQLKSVPAKLKKTKTARELLALRDWLKEHERSCQETIEMWMLRSIPVLKKVLSALWPDPAWSVPLTNCVVTINEYEGGFLREVDNKKGIGVVNLDGETLWLKADQLFLQHPILLADLEDYRELAAELDFTQGISQLFRETWPQPKKIEEKAYNITEFADGRFEQLNYALSKCKTLGYRVSGGYAVCPVWEDGAIVEARYWVGADYPEGETWTGDLSWVDENEKVILLSKVGPVAFSEGMRMASAIYAGRKVEEEGDED